MQLHMCAYTYTRTQRMQFIAHPTEWEGKDDGSGKSKTFTKPGDNDMYGNPKTRAFPTALPHLFYPKVVQAISTSLPSPCSNFTPKLVLSLFLLLLFPLLLLLLFSPPPPLPPSSELRKKDIKDSCGGVDIVYDVVNPLEEGGTRRWKEEVEKWLLPTKELGRGHLVGRRQAKSLALEFNYSAEPLSKEKRKIQAKFDLGNSLKIESVCVW